MLLSRHFIAGFALCLSFVAVAQGDRLSFEDVSSELGTLHWHVNHAMEDRLGFIWIATEAGLFRYDGYQLVGYRHNVHDSTSVSSDGVPHVAEDRDGRIWASTTYGINMLDGRTGKFERYRPFNEPESTKGINIIRWLHIDQDNRLFAVGRRNFHLFDVDTHEFQLIRQEDNPSRTYTVSSMHESEDGTLWIGVSNGLLRMERGDTSFTYLNPMEGLDRNYSIVNQVTAGRDGTLLIGTVLGLVEYDPETKDIKTDLLPVEYRDERVNYALTSRTGSIWLAFSQNGFGLLRPDGSFEHYEHDDDDLTSLPENGVTCFVEDRLGNIWIGTTTGMVKVPAEYSGMHLIQNTKGVNHQSNFVWRILEDQDGSLWTQTARGIYHKPVEADIGYAVDVITGTPNETLGDWIHVDRRGDLWVPVDSKGLWRMRQGSATFIELPVDDRLKASHVNKIIEDEKDPEVLWIGTSRGLCKLHISNLESEWYIPRSQIPELSTNRVIVFEQFGDELWHYYTFENSLGRFDKMTGTYELFRPPQDQQYVLEGVVRDIDVSPDGNVWVATTFGLTQFNIETREYSIYTTRDGLRENNLYAVLVDDKGMIWVTGDQFFARFDHVNGTFKNYASVHQVKNFLSKSEYLADDGRIYFGGQNGIYTFHPDSIRIDSIPPNIVLTNFKVKDSTYMLDEAFENVQKIVLQHHQNDITFEFAGLHHISPELNRYRCMLEGYDQTWRDLGYVRAANYTNLNPGSYTFRSQAANRDGVWSEEGLAITLLISPHFTQTDWFRVLVLLVIASILYFIYRIWHYQQKLRRQKEVAEQAADYRMQFLAHISHEIRTPMNAIIGLSGLAREMPLEPRQQEYISAIEQSSQDLLAIINELLDHSKLESGKFTFVKEPFSLDAVIDQIEAMFRTLASKKGLAFAVSVEDAVPGHLTGDGLRLRQILTNLLGNAIKYTENGTVALEVRAGRMENTQIQFLVKDTGVGIAPEDLGQVFDRFTDQRKSAGTTGTGLGLYITKQLVERQGGTIQIASKVGVGTEVAVSMPFELTGGLVDSAEAQPGYDFGDIRILLVDDAPFNRMVMTEMIRKRIPHAQVTTAEDGREALDMVAGNAFDIVIMDAKMPGMDGKTATRKIRRMPGEVSNIPILGATAGAMPGQVRECLDSGMNDVLTKPIQIDALINKLYLMTQVTTPE